jgi:hypothetical protein
MRITSTKISQIGAFQDLLPSQINSLQTQLSVPKTNLSGERARIELDHLNNQKPPPKKGWFFA